MPNKDLDNFILPSIVWLASHLRMEVFTDDQIPFAAGVIEYPLPRNMAWLMWVQVGQSLLLPTSTWSMNLNTTNVATGATNWRSATPGTPTQYAVEGRALIFNPPPSSDFAAGTPFFSWRWLGTGRELDLSGTPDLSDMDQQLIRYDAALGWLAAHPSPENAARSQAYAAEIQRRLPAAKSRWENPELGFYPTLSPDTSGRWIAAR